MSLLQKSLIILVLLAAAWGLGRYTAPVKTITKVEEKIIEIVKEVSQTTTKQQVHIIETEYQDGRKVKETFIVNENTVVVEKERVVEKEKVVEKIVENKKPDWQVGATTGYNFDTRRQDYGVQVDRRIFGNVWAGSYAKTDKDIGVALKMEF
jgi:hypothetical protein